MIACERCAKLKLAPLTKSRQYSKHSNCFIAAHLGRAFDILKMPWHLEAGFYLPGCGRARRAIKKMEKESAE